MYDVIIVGARVAGASTAMLLARRGLDVLVVDRATFPSDTLSTHQVQLPGIARLARWGLLDRLIAAGTPATREVRFDPGVAVLEGRFPVHEGVDALYSPRRAILDQILVDAARAAGAEVREGFAVDELLEEDGRITGVRGHERGGGPVREHAKIVIGADGRHSQVAKAVRPPAHHEHPALSVAYYTYWEGVPVAGGEVTGRPFRLTGAWPTNDGLTMTYVAAPVAEFHALRKDIEGHVLRTLDGAGDLGERVRAGRRAERLYGTADLASWVRRPYGPGWALVGDAGLAMDPSPARGSATRSATPSCSRTRSMRGSAASGRSRRRSPATSASATQPCCRCTSSPRSSPPARRRRPSRRCSSRRSRATPRRSAASSACSRAPCPSRSTSRRATSRASSGSAGWRG